MSTVDITIVAAYLVLLFSWAIALGMRESADDYLIFSRRAPFLLIVFSLTSTWVGIGTTVATAASAYDTGISLGVTAASGGVVGAVVAGWLAPRLKSFGDRYAAHTMGDFYVVRYSEATRWTAGAFIIVVYVLLTAAQLVGLGTLLRVWTGMEYSVLVGFAAASTIVYTAFAGIKSDFYTDVVHFLTMFVVMFLVLLPVVAGQVDLVAGVAALPAHYLDPFAYGGVTFFVGGLIFGAGSMFITMEIWQRVYASASAVAAQRALYLSALVIVSFYALSSLFGIAARIVEADLGDRDQALFVLMVRFLPSGLLGLGVAAFLAIFVSTVNSTLMVLSATMAKDFYKGWLQPAASDAQLLKVSRASTLVGGALALLVALALPDLVALAVNALFMLLILVPSIIGGFFWRRATATAATASIVAGSLVLLVLVSALPEIAFVPAFIVASLVFVLVSLRSRHVPTEDLSIVQPLTARSASK